MPAKPAAVRPLKSREEEAMVPASTAALISLTAPLLIRMTVVATRPTPMTAVWTTEVAKAPHRPDSWEYSRTTTAMAIAPTTTHPRKCG